MKLYCEVCSVELPEDFTNLLCPVHYDEQVAENERLKEVEADLKEKDKTPVQGEFEPVNSITDPNYTENLEVADKPQWEANVSQFRRSGKFLWPPTREMYETIKNHCFERGMNHPQSPRKGGKHIWMPQVVDVGCGSGAGTNIISQEADFVWGIDKNPKSIQLAQEIFTRIKNGIYYSSQVTFDHIDIMADEREFQQFDVVVAIEIIEHIQDYKKFLETIIKRFTRKDKDGTYRKDESRTEFFISSPNRNSPGISDEKPRNKYHVREFRSEEMVDALAEFFGNVELMDTKGNKVEKNTTLTPVLARCSDPK